MKTTVLLGDVGNQSEVEADLFDDIRLEHFDKAQNYWRPVLLTVVNALKLAGETLPLYAHWDWTQKAKFLQRLDVTFFGIERDGHMQGLMKADLGSLQRCRDGSQKGKELVYVDYVQTAPWNIPKYMQVLGYEALYSRVGTRLMQGAVRLSQENQLKGRIGLHSLPEAENFYQRIGIVPMDRDAAKQNLRWFEFTENAAQEFLERYK